MPIASSEEFYEFLKRAHDEFQPFALELRFDKAHALHRTLVALYSSILELTGSCICLLERRLLVGVPVLLRATLEAYVDLVNLSSNPRYGYSLERSYLREWRKLLQEAQGGNNEYLAAISQEPSLPERIQEFQREEAKLERQGHRALNVEQRFQRAGMEKEYRSVYNSLCCASHNNLRSLMDRHIEFDAKDFTMVLYKAYAPEDAAVYVGTSAELLVRATEKVHKVLKSVASDKVSAFRLELNHLRGDAV